MATSDGPPRLPRPRGEGEEESRLHRIRFDNHSRPRRNDSRSNSSGGEGWSVRDRSEGMVGSSGFEGRFGEGGENDGEGLYL